MKPLHVRIVPAILVMALLPVAPAWEPLLADCQVEAWAPLGEVPSPCREAGTWFWHEGIAASPDALRYDPAINLCSPSGSQSPLTQRDGATIVQAGRMIAVWGGLDNLGLHYDGALYDIETDQWIPMAAAGAPSARYLAAGVWSGTEILIWGGRGASGLLGDGGAYSPATGNWRTIPASAQVAARWQHAAIWTGSVMVVWGGSTGSSPTNTGGQLDPTTMTWNATSTTGAPETQYLGPAILGAGTKMMVTGGHYDETVEMPPGVFGAVRHYRPVSHIYDPAADEWTSHSPGFSVGEGFSAVWTGLEAIFWGGARCSQYFSPAGPDYWIPYCDSEAGGNRVDAMGQITAVTTTDQPQERYAHVALWADSRMLLWGGSVAVFEPPDYSEFPPTGDASYRISPPIPNVDADRDGFGSCEAPQDCDDLDDSIWQTPGETAPLTATYDLLAGSMTLTWPAPALPGAAAPTFDVLRSLSPWDFVADAQCVESNDSDLMAIDGSPVFSPPRVDFYLVRVENQCPGRSGLGPLGFDSTGTEKPGRSCP